MIPLRPSQLKYNTRFPKYIIIHHSHELDLHSGSLLFDTQKLQYNTLTMHNYQHTAEPELPYHFVVDYLNNDFEIFVSRPLLTKIEYEDLDPIYESSVHVGLIGNYSGDIPVNRLYSILCFRVLVPCLRLFRLNPDDILLHKEISYDPDCQCPGELFNMGKLKTTLMTYIRKTSLSRI